jgi:hypothetical protein
VIQVRISCIYQGFLLESKRRIRQEFSFRSYKKMGHLLAAVGQFHRQIPNLLRNPRPVRLGGHSKPGTEDTVLGFQ